MVLALTLRMALTLRGVPTPWLALTVASWVPLRLELSRRAPHIRAGLLSTSRRCLCDVLCRREEGVAECGGVQPITSLDSPGWVRGHDRDSLLLFVLAGSPLSAVGLWNCVVLAALLVGWDWLLRV